MNINIKNSIIEYHKIYQIDKYINTQMDNYIKFFELSYPNVDLTEIKNITINSVQDFGKYFSRTNAEFENNILFKFFSRFLHFTKNYWNYIDQFEKYINECNIKIKLIDDSNSNNISKYIRRVVKNITASHRFAGMYIYHFYIMILVYYTKNSPIRFVSDSKTIVQDRSNLVKCIKKNSKIEGSVSNMMAFISIFDYFSQYFKKYPINKFIDYTIETNNIKYKIRDINKIDHEFIMDIIQQITINHTIYV